LKFEADFHPKMSVCKHKLGGGGSTPQTIPTLYLYRQFSPVNFVPTVSKYGMNEKVRRIDYLEVTDKNLRWIRTEAPFR